MGAAGSHSVSRTAWYETRSLWTVEPPDRTLCFSLVLQPEPVRPSFGLAGSTVLLGIQSQGGGRGQPPPQSMLSAATDMLGEFNRHTPNSLVRALSSTSLLMGEAS